MSLKKFPCKSDAGGALPRPIIDISFIDVHHRKMTIPYCISIVFCLLRGPLKVLEGERPIRGGGHLGDHAVSNHCHLILAAKNSDELKLATSRACPCAKKIIILSVIARTDIANLKNAPESCAHEAVEELQKVILAEVPVAAPVRDGEEVAHL